MHHCEKAAGKLTSHSLKATLLQLSMLRRGINDQDRMVVGHHVSRVKMTLTYSRDAASRPLRVFEKLMGENSFRKLWPGNSFQIWPNQQAKARPGSQNKSHRIQNPPQKARAMLRGFIQQSAKVESRVRAIEAQLQATGTPATAMNWLCLGFVSVMSSLFEWCLSVVPVVSQLCFSGVLVMLWWCLCDISVMFCLCFASWVVATQIFIIFIPIPAERWSNFDEHIFQMGWFNHQLEKIFFIVYSLKLTACPSNRPSQKDASLIVF